MIGRISSKKQARAIFLTAVALLLVTAALTIGAAGRASGGPVDVDSGTLKGSVSELVGQQVVDGVVVEQDEAAIENARLLIPEFSIDMAVAEDGSFALSGLPVNDDDAGYAEVTVIVTAPALGSFTYNDLRVGKGHAPILTPQLIQEPRVDNVVYPDQASSEEQEQPAPRPHSSVELGGGPASGPSCAASREPLVLPPTIRVWENGSGQDQAIHNVNFKTYAKHVLPREWPAGWDSDALGAGAVAVKSFAWWHATHAHHKACYDVDATVTHQVYDPFQSDAATNAAVDATWNYFMVLDEGLDSDIVQAFYKAGYSTDECGDWWGPGAPGDDMSQYGSQACALDGLPWYYILPTYYFSPAVDWSLRYTGDDTDGDLCKNGKESGIDQKFGGRRNLHNPYDYFNPTHDLRIRIDDALAVIGQYFVDDPGSPDLGSFTDRTAIVGGSEWDLGPPNGQQRIDDILAVVKQYFHDC